MKVKFQVENEKLFVLLDRGIVIRHPILSATALPLVGWCRDAFNVMIDIGRTWDKFNRCYSIAMGE